MARSICLALLALGVSLGCAEPQPVDKKGPITKLPTGVYTISDNHVQLSQTSLSKTRPHNAPPNNDLTFANLLASTTADGIYPGEIYAGLWLHSLPHDRFEPYLIGEPENGISPATAISDPSAALIIGSGFVSELHSLQPVGLLQKDGVTLNPILEHGYTRILGINDEGMGVVHRLDYQRDLFVSAIQAGPGIVEQGQLDIAERDLQRPKYFRAFVALCEDSWIAGVSLEPTNLRTVGQALLAYFADKSLSCDEVVNLAGDREAFLAIRLPDQSGQSPHDEAGQPTHLPKVVIHGEPQAHKVSMLGFKAVSD